MGSRDSALTELEQQAYAQFDRLVERGELFWKDSPEIKYSETPFPVFFRLSAAITSKPYNPSDTSRLPGFLDSDPDFTLLPFVAPAHKLILNKFCWARPQMILHTAEFAAQTDPLTPADLEATCTTLRRLGTRWMIVFNGGPNAGSSVAHKHLQAMPKPTAWTMFPSLALAKDPTARLLPTVPFEHRFVAWRSFDTLTPTEIYEAYTDMCTELKIPQMYSAHNILLTHEWLLVMPRRSGNVDDLCTAGANGMVGQLWLKSEQQLQHWKALGPMNVLTRFGVPTVAAARDAADSQ